jgi:DNA-directed RNA polymerase specialized sigma24 family protein
VNEPVEATVPIEGRSRSAGVSESAFRMLYPALRRYAAVVADRDADPDDLVQEALTGLLRQPPGHVRDVPVYLRRSILNAAAQHRRRQAVAHATGDRMARRAGAEPWPDYPSATRALLDAVPPRDRALLFLLDVERRAVAEVAGALGITPVTVKVRALRARRAARAALERGARHG